MTADQKAGRRLTRSVAFVVFMFLVAVVAVDKIPLPANQNVTSNVDDLEWRHLTTTTVKPKTLTSGPQRTTTTVFGPVPNDDVIVVDRGRVIRVPRTPVAEQVLSVLERMGP